jgi:hypothetical protein
MSGIAPKENAFKYKIAPHKQKSIVKICLAGPLHQYRLPEDINSQLERKTKTQVTLIRLENIRIIH